MSPTIVIGSSMFPTLNNYEDSKTRDFVYISRFSPYTYGDMIVVNNPEGNNDGKSIIKRLIAKEKDKIAIVRTDTANVSEANGVYKIYLIKDGETNFEVLNETYLSKKVSLYPSYLQFQELIASGTEGGSVKEINGIKYLEINEGYVFYMGDNRTTKSSSYDCLEYGPISKNKVVGKVDIVVYENKNHISYIFNHYIHKLFG